MSDESFKRASLVVRSVIAKSVTCDELRYHTGNLSPLPFANASRVNQKIGSPAGKPHERHAGGSPNFQVDAAFAFGQQAASPERVTQKTGDRHMAKETKTKVKDNLAFYIFVKDENGDNQYVGSIYRHDKGEGLNILMGNKRYVAFPPKPKAETEEGA